MLNRDQSGDLGSLCQDGAPVQGFLVLYSKICVNVPLYVQGV